MEKEIKRIISEEDPKNPYTDDILAGMLKMRRDRVTLLRKELNIPNSNERRRSVLLADMREILKENPSITNAELTKRLQAEGYHLSRFIIGQNRQYIEEFEKEEQDLSIAYKETISRHISGKMGPDEQEKNDQDLEDAFKSVIGFKGSIKEQIRQAQAAVLYPPNGLNILICGESGVGKSSLVESIFLFGKHSGRFSDESSLVVFNCADYADNPQLLLSQLFGHVKGAFTGADSIKEGLVHKADHGILFLDEVHRLPPEGQEKLFHLLDTGRYRRLGETDTSHKVSLMLIAATTENIESSLLLTFRRRIPVMIELPSLAERPMRERFELIYTFAVEEASKLNESVVYTRDAVKALMLYECPGNIGQMKNDIQVACARAYLKQLTGQNVKVRISLLELPFFVNSQLLLQGTNDKQLLRYVQDDLIVNPDDASRLPSFDKTQDPLREDIYQYIDYRMHQLRKQNIPPEAIREIMGSEMLDKFSEVSEYLVTHAGRFDFEELTRKFDPIVLESIYIIRDILTKKQYVDSEIFYGCLGIHLEAALKRIRDGYRIYNPNLEQIKQLHPREYSIAKEAVKELEKRWKLDIGEDECGFLAMYFQMLSGNGQRDARTGVIIVTHGRVASEILKVVQFMKVAENIAAVDMDLSEKPEVVLSKVEAEAEKLNQGKGILLLIDMGSLGYLGNIISEKTGIAIRVVDRVDTLMVIHAMEQISEGFGLEEVARTIRRTPQTTEDIGFIPKKQNAILTICVTGEGAALTLKKMLENAFVGTAYENIPIIPIGYLSEKNLLEEIKKNQKQYEVVATVGTINPNLAGITFISLQEIMGGKGLDRLYRNLSTANNSQGSESYDTISIPEMPVTQDLFDSSLILHYKEAAHKGQVIEDLCRVMHDCGYVTDEYTIDVYRRELIGPAVYKGRVAIPHGLYEHVIKPCIAVATLEKPVEWIEGVPVKLVFLLALPEESHEIMISLTHLFNQESILNTLLSKSDPEEIKHILSEAMFLSRQK